MRSTAYRTPGCTSLTCAAPSYMWMLTARGRMASLDTRTKRMSHWYACDGAVHWCDVCLPWRHRQPGQCMYCFSSYKRRCAAARCLCTFGKPAYLVGVDARGAAHQLVAFVHSDSTQTMMMCMCMALLIIALPLYVRTIRISSSCVCTWRCTSARYHCTLGQNACRVGVYMCGADTSSCCHCTFGQYADYVYEHVRSAANPRV